MKKYLFFLILIISYKSAFTQCLVIAHRGASAIAPENTLAAFEAAIKSGADYIETDIQQTIDGTVVIMHDLSVNRTCDIPAKIKSSKRTRKILIQDLSLSEFQQLKIKGRDYAPPTLDSALKLINGRIKLLIELKKGNNYYPGIETKVLEIIKQNNAYSWVNIIHSFDKESLLQLNEKNTGIKLQKLIVFRFPLGSFNFSRNFDRDDFSKWQGVNSYYRFTSKRLIRQLHKQNKTVYAWTVNSPKWAKKLINRKIDGIITDNPALIKEIIDNK